MGGDLTMITIFSESEYGHRMINYYPPAIYKIKDYQAIVGAEYPEIEGFNKAKEDVLKNAYIMTMDENRIVEWEKALKLTPYSDSTIEERRDVILSRIRGQGKLNTAAINSIVNAFTGGTANSWVEGSTLYVEITPPPTNKQYRFENVEEALQVKVPAHLGLVVIRNYFTWDELNNKFSTWQDVKETMTTWEDVLLYVENT